ncbi:MAG: toll/interleukin-1 receptor domain-containing protein [Cyanobacteriota bacterium]
MTKSYDLFISYKQHELWTSWFHDHLVTLLKTFLLNELGREPLIFIDQELDPGETWPQRIGEALGRTSVLVPALNHSYLQSQWCLHELDLMCKRRLRHPESCVVFPLIVHNCKSLPDPISQIQVARLERFYNPHIQRQTKDYYDFSEEVRKLAPKIANAIHTAPKIDSSWVEECITHFKHLQSERSKGRTLSLSTLDITNISSHTTAFPSVKML